MWRLKVKNCQEKQTLIKWTSCVTQDYGRNIYTLRDVVDEIRDKATRRSLAFLPYQLIFREPRPELITLGE